jgi:hypothetical protein
MLAFQSMFLYSKDRGRHKEWTAASEAILTGLELALAREEVFDYSNNYKNQLCHSCSSSKSQYPRARLYTWIPRHLGKSLGFCSVSVDAGSPRDQITD